MKVAICSIGTGSRKISRKELIEDLVENGHTVVYIGQASNKKRHPDYEKYNIQFLPIPIGRSNTNPFKEIKTLLVTRKVIKENNIDAILIYGIRTFPIIVIAAKLSGVKSITCIVNGTGRLFQISGFKGTVIRFMALPMLKIALALADNILFQNSDNMEMIKEKKLLSKENYGIVNGSGVNLEKYSSVSLVKEPIFLMIGRLTGDKGVNEYVRASIKVKQKYPKSKFYLVGPIDDMDLSLNMNLINKAVFDGTINLIGRVDDVRPYIDKSRVFVLPSYHEGLPRTVLEAMAMGRPIITTDAPGCRETVIENVNGFLVPIADDEALAEKMIWMIENNEKVDQMGVESLRICREKFDVNKVNKVIIYSIESNIL